MAIQFSGLATGLDTESIISQLMELERAPITRMEGDKTWLSSKLAGYKEFNTSLNSFLGSVSNISDRDQYYQKTATAASTEFFTASAEDDAIVGTSYLVEVVSLAQVQKSVTDGYASKTDENFGTGQIGITIGGDTHYIDIESGDNSLEGIMQAINEADIGIRASVINDGTENPYRLTFTGESVGQSFTIDTSALVGGTETIDPVSESQSATQAHVRVDGIDIYSDNNTITDGIPGVSLSLNQAEEGTTTLVSVKENNDAIRNNINAFISGYNEVVSFVSGQSTLGDTDAGILGGDTGLSAIKRHLQDMLTTFMDTGGSIQALSQLGLETQKDGTLTLNSTVLNSAIENDLDSVVTLLAGEEDGDGGLGQKFEDYLSGLTDSIDGLYAGRQKSINDSIARIDAQIEKMEERLEKREETLLAQFNAMEQLVSTMNSQSSFLTTQLASIENIMNYKSSS